MNGILRLIGCLLAFFVSGSMAQNVLTERYNMTCLDLSAGLPHLHVNQIFADSQGFVWISTYGGGAVRYDGYSFTMPVLERHAGSSSNSCQGFAEDGHQRLWVAYDEQTTVVDMRTMGSTVPKYGKGDIGELLKRPSVKVYCDTKGSLWHLTRDSIFRYTFNENGSVDHISKCRYRGNTPEVSLVDIDHNGTVWINVENGLYRLIEENGKLVLRDIAPVMKRLQGAYVTDMLKRGSTVWISTNIGLFAYDTYTGAMTEYHHTADAHSLSHDYATALATTPEGRLLVGTLRGMSILDEQNGTFSHWNTATDGIPMPSDFVHCLMIRYGQIWIGTETAGIVKLSPRPLMLRNYIHEDSHPGSLSHNPVNAMYVEADGTLWVGTVEGGLNRKGAGDTFSHWTTSNSPLSHNSVSVLEADGHGRLWIGTWGGGLNYISLTEHSQVHPVSMPPSMTSLTSYIGSLAYDKYNDGLWVGSNDGIFFYDFRKGTLEDPFPENRSVRGCIGAHVDKDGFLWMGCISGVCVIDLRSPRNKDGAFKSRKLSNKLDHPESPVIDKISCFCETKDGTLWLGSNGYGLYRRVVDKKSGEEHFENLTADDGLANNAVKGIVEDIQGRLWITTDNGLSVYNPRTRTFINYGERDGLHSQRFYWNSAVKGTDGYIYLGSVDGLTEIRGENMDDDNPIHLTFTRLMVDNQVITAASSKIIDADISLASIIRLHESNKSFSIDFSALTYGREVQGHYSYRMRGFEEEWNTLKPGEHSVRYTSLKPGSYVFEVAYTAEADEDERHVISIRVEVAPYFWKSWWFTMLLILLAVGVGIRLYRMRLEAWRKQEAEKLLKPIRKALEETDDSTHLQLRIQNILDNHERLEKSFHRSVEADKQEVTQKNVPFMERATEIMEQNYMNSEFDITAFADALGMSKSLVSKRLNAETGVSTGQFIRNYRLSIARKLIMENYADRNITEIAYAVGFNDPKYFTRCFTRHYGSSPSTYMREEHMDKGEEHKMDKKSTN